MRARATAGGCGSCAVAATVPRSCSRSGRRSTRRSRRPRTSTRPSPTSRACGRFRPRPCAPPCRRTRSCSSSRTWRRPRPGPLPTRSATARTACSRLASAIRSCAATARQPSTARRTASTQPASGARSTRGAAIPRSRPPDGYARCVPGNPLRVAVVGSGPAGFYAADALLRSDDPPVEVDVLDRLPTPWGLVRLGVAPDHENIKAVSRAFERTAARPGFRFFGNVEVGSTVSHTELLESYDAVVYTVGAQTDRRLGVPGEDLPGSWPATAFVAWYNGHPDFQDCEFNLDVERVVVIGNGNVAIDCARMLALTAEELAPTDTTDEAVEAIVSAPIREIVMLGRRGPVQAAFTPPELKELGELAGADVVVDPRDLELDPISARELQADLQRAGRNVETLRDYAARQPTGKPRRIVLRFLVSPTAIVGDGRVEGVEVVRNALVEDGGRLVARPTGETELIPAGLVLR